MPVPSGSLFCPASKYPAQPLGSSLWTVTPIPNIPGMPGAPSPCETKELEPRPIASSLRLFVLSTVGIPRALALLWSADHRRANVRSMVLGRCMDCSHLPWRSLAQGQAPPTPNSLPRVQKTFSAGPRSFSFIELWFPGGIAASGVQPVIDSRHGRITYKVSVSGVNLRCKESCPGQSVLRAQSPTPLLAQGGPQNSTCLHRSLAPLARAAASNQTAGLWVQPHRWLAAAL